MVKIIGGEVGNFDGKVLVKDAQIIEVLKKRKIEIEDGVAKISIPNAVAFAGVKERTLGTRKERDKKELLDFSILNGEYKGRYTIGKYAYKTGGEVIIPNKETEKTTSKATMIMMIGMLAYTLYDPSNLIKEEIVHLGTVLPNEEYFENPDQVKEFATKLKEPVTVKFEHPEFDGAQIGIQVEKVKLMPEGPAGHFASTYDWEGAPIDEDDEEITTFNVNIGSIDYNWSLRENGEFVQMHGGKYGTMDAYVRLQEELKEEFGIAKDIHAIDHHVRNKMTLRLGKHKVENLHERANKHFEESSMHLANLISRDFSAKNIDQRLFAKMTITGGGGPLWSEYLQKIFVVDSEVCSLSKNCRFDNLEGVLKQMVSDISPS